MNMNGHLAIPSGTNWRNGTDRISYHPEWSKSLPFVTYSSGTAGRHFPSLNDAMIYMGWSLDERNKAIVSAT